MRYIVGFIDKWISIFFIIIALFVLFLVDKCSNRKDDDVTTDKIEAYSGQIDNSNSNISGIRAAEGTTYQDNESGLIITIAKAWKGQVDCNYVSPNGEKGHDYFNIGEGFGFIGSNNKNYDAILLSTNEDKYAVFSIKEGNKFLEKVKEDINLNPTSSESYEFNTLPNEFIGYVLDDETFLDKKFDTKFKIIGTDIDYEDKSISGDFVFYEYSKYETNKLNEIREKLKLYENDSYKYRFGDYAYEVKIIKIFNIENLSLFENFEFSIDKKKFKVSNGRLAIIKIKKTKLDKSDYGEFEG